jgi:hypothetical protein
MPPDFMQGVNLLATVVGFALTAVRVGALLATIETKLDGVAEDVDRVEKALTRDVERLERIVQTHGEKIARLEARFPHA